MENKQQHNNQSQTTQATQEEQIIEKLDKIETIMNNKQQIDNENALKKIEVNKKLRRNALFIVIASISLISLYVFTLTQMGLSSKSYSYVSDLSSYAGPAILILPLITGMYTAYRIAHPISTYSERSGIYWRGVTWLAVILIGLFMGVIPGIILLIIFLFIDKPKNEVEHEINAIDPNAPIKIKSVNVFLVILGFFAGIIPGLIYAFLITYPLSQHACKLSGAKYC